jgi:hypothetical protein
MNERLGEIAYNAYCAKRDWKSVRGEPLPHWNQQDEALREAWVAAASAVATVIVQQTGHG